MRNRFWSIPGYQGIIESVRYHPLIPREFGLGPYYFLSIKIGVGAGVLALLFTDIKLDNGTGKQGVMWRGLAAFLMYSVVLHPV